MSLTHVEGFVLTASVAKAPDVELAVTALIEAGGADCSTSSGFKVVCSGHPSFQGVVHVGSGIQTSVNGIIDGVVNALNLGVPLVTSTGSDVHQLMEHGHS